MTACKPEKHIIKHIVEVLRSGNYKQNWGGLRDGPEKKALYCCLGVITDRYIKLNKKRWYKSVNGAYGLYDRQPNGDKGSFNDTGLPTEVMAWCGLEENPQLMVPPALRKKAKSASASAISLNDSLGFSFAEIADCFEYTYLRDEIAAESLIKLEEESKEENAENKEV